MTGTFALVPDSTGVPARKVRLCHLEVGKRRRVDLAKIRGSVIDEALHRRPVASGPTCEKRLHRRPRATRTATACREDGTQQEDGDETLQRPMPSIVEPHRRHDMSDEETIPIAVFPLCSDGGSM